MQAVRKRIPEWLKSGTALLAALLLSAGVRATHIIGGDVSMRAVGTTPGLFRLQLNQYWDETKTGAGNRDPVVKLLVFRKNNPILIEGIILNLKEAVPLAFGNAACAKLRNLNFTEARYYANYQFDPSRYTDPGGYYMVWERCCRNDGLTNVNSAAPDGVAMVFYLEFPPMQKNGRAFTNSAPDFHPPNGDYICLNKLFTFDAGAVDADGDQLRYSLVTPLNGYTNRMTPSTGDESPKKSYPTINWGPGYSLTNIIPGNPALSIDAATGKLSVRASQEGLYLFTVQCEEIRNGERIGVVRRDFQLPVVDCSKTTPPPAVVMVNGQPTTDLVRCAGQPLVLTVEKNPIWAYQWQKDGNNLRGATADTLQVRDSGVYTVVKSQASTCSNDTMSQAVNVKFTQGAPVTLSVLNPKPNCAGDTLTLQATSQPDYTYRWRRDGQDLAGAQQASLRVSQPGQYMVLIKSASAVCPEGRDSLNVTLNARPTAQIVASAPTFCAGDSVQLSASNANGYRYRWQRDNAPLSDTVSRVVARQAGAYRVTVTGPTGCTASSANLRLTQYDRPVVQFDSLAPVCSAGGLPVSLVGQPTGGTYSGPGVIGDRFDPATAGVGLHTLTYTVTSDKGCRAGQNRRVRVLTGPNLTGQTLYRIAKGSSVQLLVQANESVSRYAWSPPTALSRADIASPVASPAETTPYQLTAINTFGCSTTLTVRVEVVEPLYIPSAFSPNADGQNDSWVILNIQSFPRCEVMIYNRWGELIFYSRGYAQPWDGIYGQKLVETGIYTYQIRTNDEALPATYRGQLTVIR